MDSNNRATFSYWPALLLLAVALPLGAQETAAEKNSEQPLPEEPEQSNQSETGEQPLPDDFKPSEEISEDFPVPLPSDI